MSEKPDTTDAFVESDFSVLRIAVSLMPDLELAAYAAKIGKSRLRYPLENHSAMKPLFDRGAVATFRERTITYAQAERFIPESFFPITDERDLITKLLIALQLGAATHAAEAGDRPPPDDGASVLRHPMPFSQR